ncbi:YcnI family protein [Solihabitans fulvus]|uniref:YcnI family protein n=1 Tax=Solihabitans fulvus TaxID=1892852 RepID=A0A5B2WK63_9PSEU|nr:YcnI family protein [Solihabitans fulvus]KAA2252251.1 YcnI family protein [Solihabitans fulvus]
MRIRSICVRTVATAAVLWCGVGVADAHVTAQPGTATKGGYAKIAFRVPTESATAGTVGLTVTLPADHPLASVALRPALGWAGTAAKESLVQPVSDDDGRTITERVATVTWQAQPGTRIAPGEFTEFEMSVGPLPTDADQLLFPAVQTYDDGSTVHWDQPPAKGGPEPEHPAPAVTLLDRTADTATAGHTAAALAGTDRTSLWLSGAALLLGAAGVGLGIGAVLRSRRAGRS